MKQYIKAIFPAEFKHNVAYRRAFILGVIMLMLALAQLFTFEDFPAQIAAMRVPGNPVVPWLLAIVLPMLEIASLPYLLSMRLAPKQRRASMYGGLVACLLWVALTTWTTLSMGMAVESGLFGGTLATNSGWWSVLFAVLLLWMYWLVIRELPKRRNQ